MKPDFNQMSRPELRKYILENREDDEAIEALIKRSDPNSPVYPFPKTEEDVRQMQEIFQRKISQIQDKTQ